MIKNAAFGYMKVGFSDLGIVSLPTELLHGGILNPRPALEKALPDIADTLTKWRPSNKIISVKADPLTYEGTDYQNAVDHMNEDFLFRRWGDGLPLIPPTKERVDWLMKGICLPGYEVVAMLQHPVTQGTPTPVTVEKLAANAAMVGARPEYMPVIIASLKAFAEAKVDIGAIEPSSFAMIINGPISKEIGINSGVGALGPSSRYPANGSIGRSIFSVLRTILQLDPGTSDISVSGQSAKFNGVVFAENEDATPWEPLNVGAGFPKGTNTVTAFDINGFQNLGSPGNDLRLLVPYITKVVAPAISFPRVVLPYQNEAFGMLIVPPGAARSLAKDFNLSKQDIQRLLWENARMTMSQFRYLYQMMDLTLSVMLSNAPWMKPYVDASEDTMVPVAPSPDSFIIVVAGESGKDAWPFFHSLLGHPVTKEIETPTNWEELLYEAPRFWEEPGAISCSIE